MFFTVSLYLSLAIFTVGLLYKASTWFRYNVGIEGRDVSVSTRVAAATRGIISTLFSSKVLTLLKVFVLDGVFQARTLREDALRWFMHLCIYGGFMVLLLMHALSKFTTAILFTDYYPTVNPFLFLRDLSAILVIAGVVLAVYRRVARKGWRPATSAMDLYAIVILAVIMISGIMLEGAKILSNTVFQSMVQDYLVQPDEEQVRALSSYWVEDFGLVAPGIKEPFDPKILQEGRTIHEMSCMQCHSRPQWAPASYVASRLMKPAAEELDRANLPSVLWRLHFLACFLGLAYLPFSKMFHIFAGPLSLMANAVVERGVSAPANLATKQILELDACVHCGACTRRCSVAVAFKEIPNVNILPSEKIASLKKLAAGKDLSSRELRTIQQGLFLCTNCNRCTMVCPVGINLRDLWFSVRETLLQRSLPEPLLLSPVSLYRGLMQESLDQGQYRSPLSLVRDIFAADGDRRTEQEGSIPFELGEITPLTTLNGSIQANSFSRCYGCMTCSNACPVTRNYNRPEEVLGLLPHQLMHAIGFRQWDLVFSSMMLWDCLGCYQCQENCPQNVRVADILYELKGLAVSRADEKFA
jgi:heterodisulfide reductase subunit C/nitrate reductase gamma subunit